MFATVRTSYVAILGPKFGSTSVVSMPVSLLKEKSWLFLLTEPAASSCMVPRVLRGTWAAELLHVQAAGELSRRRIDTARGGNILQTMLVQ